MTYFLVEIQSFSAEPEQLLHSKEDDFDDRDKVLISKNSRAKHYLICALDRNIFNCVDQESSAQCGKC